MQLKDNTLSKSKGKYQKLNEIKNLLQILQGKIHLVNFRNINLSNLYLSAKNLRTDKYI